MKQYVFVFEKLFQYTSTDTALIMKFASKPYLY